MRRCHTGLSRPKDDLTLSGLWQIDVEGAALAHLAGEPDMPASLVDDAMHHRQPQPGAFSDILGGKKRFEDPSLRLKIHAVAGIADRQQHIAAGCDPDMLESVIGIKL